MYENPQFFLILNLRVKEQNQVFADLDFFMFMIYYTLYFDLTQQRVEHDYHFSNKFLLFSFQGIEVLENSVCDL